VLIGIGAAFLATGGALLGTSYALSADTAADQTRNQGMLVSGSFLAATGAVALIGGIVITIKGRRPTQVALYNREPSPQLAVRF
jgi:hypothetical protein